MDGANDLAGAGTGREGVAAVEQGQFQRAEDRAQVERVSGADVPDPASREGEGLSYVRPSAAFYLFLDIHSTGLGAREFAYRLPHERQVCVCPGDSFGLRGANSVRVTLAGDPAELEESLRRLADFVRANRV
ncbi:hypothetical protein [Streptomyces sp. NPDC048606]|uniref:hypothetical protein n=1 Tax=Streptomyces sp. NPDC048606 TaxID=3154726 RepID=UPI00343E0C06